MNLAFKSALETCSLGVWKWMLKIGYEPGLRPDKKDPYCAKVENLAAEKLRGHFQSLTREARDIVREWLRNAPAG